jgi:hypothetical protein
VGSPRRGCRLVGACSSRASCSSHARSGGVGSAPASSASRRASSRLFLVERGLEQDGYAALQALVNDYITQSQRRDEPAILVNLEKPHRPAITTSA